MACWNRVTAHVVDGLPKQQVEGLCYARKVPLIYGRAGAEQLAGVRRLEGREHQPARHEPVLGQPQRERGRRLRPHRHAGQVLRADAEPAAERAGTAVLHGRAEPPRRVPQLFAYSTGQQMLRERSWAELEDSVIDVIDRP